jgi:hypothetical protein
VPIGDINVSTIRHLRGRFQRTPKECFWATTYVYLIFSLPVYFALHPPAWWPAASLRDRLFPIGTMSALCIFALWVAYAQTTSYEFDGFGVTCRRYPNRVLWTEPLAGLISARRVPARYWDRLKLEWPDRRRSLAISDDLDRALHRHPQVT